MAVRRRPRGLHSEAPEARAGALAAGLLVGPVGPLGGAVEGPKSASRWRVAPGRRTGNRTRAEGLPALSLSCAVCPGSVSASFSTWTDMVTAVPGGGL